uniref:Uncharacterized protein n=1 Tax=Janibacter limosus TaxID=53458 RepID=A0AC61U823_9MICO|nr:hypothetical protein [Janibacter limosus]
MQAMTSSTAMAVLVGRGSRGAAIDRASTTTPKTTIGHQSTTCSRWAPTRIAA